MSAFRDLFDSNQFSAGFVVGAIALLVAYPLALGLAALFPKRAGQPGLIGPAFAVATVVALLGSLGHLGSLGTDRLWPVPDDVLIALGLLWLAGAVAARTPAPWLVGPIVAIPGAVVLAGANDGSTLSWVPRLIVIGAMVIGAATADLDRRTAWSGVAALMLFVSVVGIYFTVPDTELMRAVVGVSVPLVLLAFPYAAASLGSGGAYAAVGILLWIIPIEGIGRAGSIVGAAGTFVLLLGEPVGRALGLWLEGRSSLRRVKLRGAGPVVVAAQIVFVVYATRVAGKEQDAGAALVLMLPALVAAIAFGVFLAIPERVRRLEVEE